MKGVDVPHDSEIGSRRGYSRMIWRKMECSCELYFSESRGAEAAHSDSEWEAEVDTPSSQVHLTRFSVFKGRNPQRVIHPFIVNRLETQVLPKLWRFWWEFWSTSDCGDWWRHVTSTA